MTRPTTRDLADAHEDLECQDYRHPFGTCDCWERLRLQAERDRLNERGLRAVLQWKLDRDGELP